MARRKKEGGWAGPTKKHGPLHSAFFSSVQPSSLSLSLSVQPNIIYQKLHSGSWSKIKRKKQRGSQARSWCGSSEAWKQRFETGRKHTAPTGQPGLVSRIGDVLRARRWPVGHRELGPTGKISIFFQNPAPPRFRGIANNPSTTCTWAAPSPPNRSLYDETGPGRCRPHMSCGGSAWKFKLGVGWRSEGIAEKGGLLIPHSPLNASCLPFPLAVRSR
jgi:hypothetical protein